MEYSNIKLFFIGIVICSLGAFLAVEMLNSTSWTTYSSETWTRTRDGEGVIHSTLNYTTEMEIGLREATFVERGELCDKEDGCSDYEVDWKHTILCYCKDGESSDCAIDVDTQPGGDYISIRDLEVREACATESAGSTGHSIILGGLGLLALTFVLAFIGVRGYIPGWVLKLLSSLAAIALFVGPIAWFVMLPDLNSGGIIGAEKWGLSHAFYLTLLSSPVVLVGGFVWGRMEAFALEENDDLAIVQKYKTVIKNLQSVMKTELTNLPEAVRKWFATKYDDGIIDLSNLTDEEIQDLLDAEAEEEGMIEIEKVEKKKRDGP